MPTITMKLLQLQQEHRNTFDSIPTQYTKGEIINIKITKCDSARLNKYGTNLKYSAKYQYGLDNAKREKKKIQGIYSLSIKI